MEGEADSAALAQRERSMRSIDGDSPCSFELFCSSSDVLEVLTEVDEKSRRSPEIIQYFIVSHRANRTRERESANIFNCQIRAAPKIYKFTYFSYLKLNA